MCKNVGLTDEELKRLKQNDSPWWILIAVGLFLTIFIPMAILWFRDEGPYYLGCADRHGKELLLTTKKEPTIQYGLIFLEDKMFTVPEPGMTCRVLNDSEFQEAKAQTVVDKPI